MRVAVFGILGAVSVGLTGCQVLFPLDNGEVAVCEFGERNPPMTDNFDAGTLVDWGVSFEDAGNIRIEGVLELRMNQSPGCVGITSTPFNACGVDLSIHALSGPTESATNTDFTLASGNGEAVDFFVEDNTLKLPSGTIAFGSAVAWWRFRVGPVIELQTSPDGLDWTVQAMAELFPALDAATITIEACNDVAVGQTQVIRYDDLNLTP